MKFRCFCCLHWFVESPVVRRVGNRKPGHFQVSCRAGGRHWPYIQGDPGGQDHPLRDPERVISRDEMWTESAKERTVIPCKNRIKPVDQVRRQIVNKAPVPAGDAGKIF